MKFYSSQIGILLASFLITMTGCSAPRQVAAAPVYPPAVHAQPKPHIAPPRAERTGPVVFLDAGHGGRDGGAAVTPPQLKEKELSLDIVRRVERILDGWNYRVVLSRRADVFVSLQKRVAMAARVKAAVFVSIHFNSSASRKSRGSEIYYYQQAKSRRSLDSQRLGTTILKRLCETLPTRCRGVKHGDFCVIRETTMPAVLVEAAFITNPKEARLLSSAPYKQQISWAVAKGIDDFFHQK